MSYESVVLSKNPFAYWRLDEDPGAGSQITDLSGNDYHGVYFSSAVRGMGSPIETDSNSRAVGNRIGTSADAPAPTGAFSWGGWGYYGNDPGGGAIVCRNGQIGSSGSNMVWIDHGLGIVAARINLDASITNYDLTYSLNGNFGWYRVLVSRNAGVMRLYVNGVLRAQRTDLPTGAMTNPSYLSGGGVGWKLGCSGDTGNLAGGISTDEIDLYASALTAGDEQEIYEAALATLPLRATIVINISVELNTDQIVPVDLPFAHNFSKTFGSGDVAIVEELEYKTNINQSEPDYQQRVSARPHGALRTLEYHLSPSSGAARSRFHGLLYTPGEFYTLPVWSDAGLTTAQANSGASSISCDTTLRDYEALSYCGVCTDPKDPSTYQFFQIVSVSDTALTLASTIGTTIPSGSIIFPARVASISEDSLSIQSFAADHEDAVLKFELLEQELSTRRITAYTPGTTYLSSEVFTLEAAKVSFMDDRPFDVTRRIQARGRDYQYAVDTGSPQTFPVRFLLTSAAARSEFYGWLDARQGKLNPLWVSTKERDLIPSSGTGSAITVAKTGFSLHHGRRHLEFLQTNGTLSRARVTAIVDNGNGTETWTVNCPAFANIAKVSFLKYCTLASDTIRLQHYKGGITECGLSFRELLTSPE